jgi:DNA sulfur modification protein DndB
LEYGPFWQGDENELVLKRTIAILKFWINTVVEFNEDWWNIGSGPGGGLAMNDGIAALLATLRSVFEHLEKQNHRLNKLRTNEVCSLIEPFGIELGKYLASFDEMQRKSFRDLRGDVGISYRTRQCQQGIRQNIGEFNPDGLDSWIQTQKQETNKSTKELIDAIEIQIQKFIVDELKNEYGVQNDEWWYEAVPQPVRSKATAKLEEDKNKRGGKEFYFDLIEYKKIILENWELFEKTFAFGKGNKDKRTDWLDFINETRKIVAHASSGKTVSIEDYQKVVEYHRWIIDQIEKANLEDQEESIEQNVNSD